MNDNYCKDNRSCQCYSLVELLFYFPLPMLIVMYVRMRANKGKKTYHAIFAINKGRLIKHCKKRK